MIFFDFSAHFLKVYYFLSEEFKNKKFVKNIMKIVTKLKKSKWKNRLIFNLSWYFYIKVSRQKAAFPKNVWPLKKILKTLKI